MEDYKKALNYSFLLLKYRPRSRYEMFLRLKNKGYSLEIIEEVLNYLEKNRYINDKEFSENFVSSCLVKGYGEKRVDYLLKRLGVSKELRKEALKDKESFEENLRKIAQEKITQYRAKNKKYIFIKLVRYLVGRGFDYDKVVKVLEELLGEESEYR